MTDSPLSLPPGTFIGTVKWFDTQRGFGFLKMLPIASPPAPDIFVHAVDLKAQVCQHPALYTGEYVQFSLGPSTDGKREKAVCVTGIGGGPLMCDHGRISFRSYFNKQQPEQQQQQQQHQTLAT